MAAKWTFFYYCNAESDLFDNVITMMKNMAALNYPEQPEVNILVMADRIKVTSRMDTERFYTDPELKWSNTLLFVMKPGMEPVYENAEFDYGDADMGDEEYMIDFINWGIDEYPADYYGLVIYGHGSAVSIGNMMEYISAEDLTKNMLQALKTAEIYNKKINGEAQEMNITFAEFQPSDNHLRQRLEENFPQLFAAARLPITPPMIQSMFELNLAPTTGRNSDLFAYTIRKALKALAGEKGFKPNLIIFEGCFMLSYETILELHDLTDYIIGSQGFHSRALTSNPAYLQKVLTNPDSWPPEKLARKIILDIDERLQTESIEAPTIEGRTNLNLLKPDYFSEVYAEACIKTVNFKQFNDSFNNMVNDMVKDEPAIVAARSKCLTYYINDDIEEFNIGVIDLLSFIEHLRDYAANDSLKKTAAKTARLLKRTILIHKCGTRMTRDDLPWYNPTGISILFPIYKPTVEFVGGILYNAYMIKHNFDNYVFSKESRWPDFMKPKLDELFG